MQKKSSGSWVSRSALRRLARHRAEALAEKDRRNDAADESLSTVDAGSSHASELATFLERRKSGFDRLRTAREQGMDEGWAEELDPNRALVVSDESDPEAGAEMLRLASTLGLDSGGNHKVKLKPRLDAATFFSMGQLESMKTMVQSSGSGVLIVDFELSPSQLRNLEGFFGVPVLDRQGLILGIFKQHARTHRAKLQVELAELKYYSTRLAGLWMGLSRQRGGRGGLKGRGGGETQLELDRRTVRRRIQIIADKLKKEEQIFAVQSSKRRALPCVALVGYTNAGKSTLMQRLTGARVLSEDKLFSTLDTTVRLMKPPTDPQILVSDTVGFIRRLPHDLVESFRSTLQEAVESQVLVVVVDPSQEDWKQQIEVTSSALDEIGAQSVPRILVLNKTDLLGSQQGLAMFQLRRQVEQLSGFVGKYWVSAKENQGVSELRHAIMEQVSAREKSWAQAMNVEALDDDAELQQSGGSAL